MCSEGEEPVRGADLEKLQRARCRSLIAGLPDTRVSAEFEGRGDGGPIVLVPVILLITTALTRFTGYRTRTLISA